MDYDRILDTSGLSCPVPLLKITREIKKIEVNQVLKLISTDPGCTSNIPIWCSRHKHNLLNSTTENDKLVFYVRRN